MLTDSLPTSSLITAPGETPARDEVSEFSPMIGLNCSLMSPIRNKIVDKSQEWSYPRIYLENPGDQSRYQGQPSSALLGHQWRSFREIINSNKHLLLLLLPELLDLSVQGRVQGVLYLTVGSFRIQVRRPGEVHERQMDVSQLVVGLQRTSISWINLWGSQAVKTERSTNLSYQEVNSRLFGNNQLELHQLVKSILISFHIEENAGSLEL